MPLLLHVIKLWGRHNVLFRRLINWNKSAERIFTDHVVKAKNNKEKHIQFYSTNIFTVMEEPVIFFFFIPNISGESSRLTDFNICNLAVKECQRPEVSLTTVRKGSYCILNIIFNYILPSWLAQWFPDKCSCFYYKFQFILF